MTEIKDDARYQSDAYKSMCAAWAIVSDVSAGTLKMREKGETYLPKFPLESKDSYKARLSTATLYNFYAKTVEAMCGLVFRKDPELGDDVPEAIKKLWEDIDGQGTHGDVFSKGLLKKQFDGHVFIVAEYPAKDPNITNKEQELASGRRPYLIRYEACQATNWDFIKIGGKVLPSQVTFREEITERIGDFKQATIVRHRTWRLEEVVDGDTNIVTRRATWELQKEVKDEKTGEITLVSDGNGVTSLTRIPLAVAYGNKTGEWTSQPPLLDLALKNIEHYQDHSDYRKGKSIAGIAIPWIRNPKESKEGGSQPLGWDVLIEVEENGEVGFAEAAGAALDAQRTALEDTKAEMASLGLAMLVKNDTAVTATQRIIDAAQESSQLSTIARSLEDAIELAFSYIAEYLGLPEGGSVSLELEDGRLVLDPQTITVLESAADSGKLSLETFLTILQQGGVLPDGVSVKDELKRIQSIDVIPRPVPGGQLTGGL